MAKTVIGYEDEATLRKQIEYVFYAIKDDFILLETYPEPSNVLQHIENLKPDIVLMDIQMDADEDGLHALYKIKKTYPQVKVMMLTTFDIDDKIFNAICLGADGYMLKTDFSSHQLPHEAMRKSLKVIFDGGAYLTPSVAKRILNLFTDLSISDKMVKVRERFKQLFQKETEEQKSSSSLTKMQTTVLLKIKEGKSTAEIARELELKENTINTHIKGIYSALEVHSRTMALKKAYEEGLVS